ncbi:M20/M25/M40 family metallo-hydrolase [Aquimarina brevivitae]|uniref:Putative secreted protein (Por secretion system target) n=1 Tax=Aquimarina brevivitae TaxID=323412 RepID=A0A4V2F7I3_9FLAO|nr:M20/M25/M40 family metallo-hydrolase [Aquimarina brevivitae]RZS99919.1 putative secreted protein (Por secretion system target) [Aquimarina brevivitae]
MKNFKLQTAMVLLFFLFHGLYAQKSPTHFYGTMQTEDAIDLRSNHPKDIQIIESMNGYSAVLLSEKAAEELHHKVLVHGPGFLYEDSKEKAIAAIKKINTAQTKAARISYAITQQDLVRQSLDLVNNQNIANQIQQLEAYGTRYHTTNSARQSVLDLKTIWEGLAGNRTDVNVRLVNHSSTNMPSLVMTVTGTENPDEFVILGGHIDSTAGGSNSVAPGADDNASGIATITEVARVLFDMNFKPKRTIEFMAFAAEEVGLRGSKEIAESYRNNNVNVVSYMQLDMTNYKGSVYDAYISTDSYNDDDLNNFMIALLNFYNASGTHQITYGTSRCNYGCSDHYSWAQQGYNVTFPFEAKFGEHNPNIHTTRDTFDRSPTPNATHAAKFAKLGLEYMIEIANGVETDPGGEECATTISSYPYLQSFENTIGQWTQVANDDLDWSVDANGTPSSGTGPSSAANGNYYIYVEASGNGTGYPNKKAELLSPCFELSNLTNAELSFSYHMQGSSVGTLNMDLSEDEGATWSSVFTISGSQGSSWQTATIDLSAYTGSVQLRLGALTATSWQGDITVDQITIAEASGDPDPDPDLCEALNFNEFSMVSFSNQDSDGTYTIASDGSALSLTNNTWKYIAYPYTVTASTVVEVTLSSTSEGEIHGFGFENDNSLTSSRYFKLHGTQNYGITNYDNYSGGSKTYVIPVGDFYTGAMDRLVFINDHDSGSGNTSTFSNVKIYEGSCARTSSIVQFGTTVPVYGNEEEVTKGVLIYPNPAQNTFEILVAKNSGIDQATIYSLSGQRIASFSLTSGRNQFAIAQLKLSAGMYLVKTTGPGGEEIVHKLSVE